LYFFSKKSAFRERIYLFYSYFLDIFSLFFFDMIIKKEFVVLNKEMMTANIKVDKSKWNIFKKVAKAQNSDASKEIRKFIDRYIKDNKDLIEKLF